MQQSSNSDEGVSEINVTPLADVTLVLLIMLMVLSPVALQTMIPVKAASAAAGRATKSMSDIPVFVDIRPEGFSLNGQSVPSEYQLYRSIQKITAADSTRTVLISAAPEVKYHKVVRVLDLVRQGGASNLSLVPRKGSAS